MTGYHRVETVTFVTIASYQEPRPSEASPLATLAKAGVAEMDDLREILQRIKKVAPIDATFGAVLNRLIGAVGEMHIHLTGDERTGLAEVPFMNHSLALDELPGAERIGVRSGNSLRLISANRENADFLLEYGKRRKEALLNFAEMNGAHHVLAVGMPVLIQAIAWTFAGGQAGSQDVATIIPRNGSVVQIDFSTGRVLIPQAARAVN